MLSLLSFLEQWWEKGYFQPLPLSALKCGARAPSVPLANSSQGVRSSLKAPRLPPSSWGSELLAPSHRLENRGRDRVVTCPKAQMELGHFVLASPYW